MQRFSMYPDLCQRRSVGRFQIAPRLWGLLTLILAVGLLANCTSGDRPLPTATTPAAEAVSPDQAGQVIADQPGVEAASPPSQPEDLPAPTSGAVVAPTAIDENSEEIPARIAAAIAAVGGALLPPETLQEIAAQFAQAIQYEGQLSAVQFEVTDGSDPVLATSIYFVAEQGQMVGLLYSNPTANDQVNNQLFFWATVDGTMQAQYANSDNILNPDSPGWSEIEAIWLAASSAHSSSTTVAEQVETAEAAAQQHWQVYSSGDILASLADPESKLREQAKYVLGADRLSNEGFAEQLGDRMGEITTVVKGSSRTNVAVFDSQTNLDDVATAVTAAREQGLNLLGSTLLYVTNDASGVMRIWHTGTVGNNYKMEWLSKSYGGLNTFLGFFSYDSTTGEVHFEDLIQENYITLGMGTRETWGQISSPTLEYRVAYSKDGTSTMLSITPISKAFEFEPDPTAPSGYKWQSYARPDMRENGAAEIMPSLDKVRVVLADLDTITSQSSDPAWFEGALQDYNGAHYLEVTDTSRDGRFAYLVLVSIDATTGERLYGPIVLVNSGNFDPNSGSELIRANQPLNDTQLAQESIFRTHQSGLAWVMIENNIMVINANSDLPPTHKSSHTVSKHFGRKVPINLIHFNLNLLESEPELRSRSALNTVLFETFELLGHEYFAAGAKPPLEGFFFTLNPQANQTLVETDFFAFLHNAHLNALAWLINNQQLFSKTDFQRTIEASQFNIDSFLRRIGTQPDF